MISSGSMDIKMYTLEELESHIHLLLSDKSQTAPLSPLRLSSYLTNPRAEPKDHVLFELWNEDKLVAYRTLLPDIFFDQNHMPHRFAWLSGNWVDPAFRRQGFSTKLLQQAEARWEGRLMYTNFAPSSKAVYDRTGQFPLLTQRDGKRFYLRAANEELLGERLGSKDLLRVSDQVINRFREGKLQKFQPVDNSRCKVESITHMDKQIDQLLSRFKDRSLFNRDTEDFRWILEQPWVTSKQTDTIKYHFSYTSSRFQNLLLKFFLPDQSMGFLWLVVHNQTMSAPYVFVESEKIFPFMARELLHAMIIHGCTHTTIRHKQLAEQMMVHKSQFLSVRNMPQKIFVHKLMADRVPPRLDIQDGDGDVVFTG